MDNDITDNIIRYNKVKIIINKYKHNLRYLGIDNIGYICDKDYNINRTTLRQYFKDIMSEIDMILIIILNANETKL